MFRNLAVLFSTILACAIMALPGIASAQSQIGPTSGPLICCLGTGPTGYVGQTFRVPAGQTVLTAASLNVAASAAGQMENFVLELRPVTGGVVAATVLASSGTLSTAANSSTGGQGFTFAPVGGLAVTPLTGYAIVARRTGGFNGLLLPLINGNAYADGVPFQSAGGVYNIYEAYFQVNFASPAPTPVPTMSEWAMILLGLTLAGGAVLYIQRRRPVA